MHGVVRRTSNLLRSRIEHLRADEGIYGSRFFLHYGDLLDATTLRRIFSKVQPSEVYHLAGQSHVGLSFEIPESTCDEIATATLRLLEICRDQTTASPGVSCVELRDFRGGGESPQTERHAAAADQPVWVREGVRDVHGPGLSRGAWDVCL